MNYRPWHAREQVTHGRGPGYICPDQRQEAVNKKNYTIGFDLRLHLALRLKSSYFLHENSIIVNTILFRYVLYSCSC